MPSNEELGVRLQADQLPQGRLPEIEQVIAHLRGEDVRPEIEEYLRVHPEMRHLLGALKDADREAKQHIAVAAYYRWVKGGQKVGTDKADWQEAAKELGQQQPDRSRHGQ